MVTVEIDGKKLQVETGSMIIEAADEHNITIPRFCYHKKLSVAANCRMCLVEVDTARKTVPACATPVTDGMKVYTRSKAALESQRIVMEFLLINHPLDCPICDQGGECELQDYSMAYGQDVSRYTEGKRVVADENLGSLIATDMTRCIHCTRCIRFGEEVAGCKELGMTSRGEQSRVGTYIEHSLRSEVSGNVIDLCPVGALTSKPYRFTARAWELTSHESIASHDCIGSNIQLHSRRGEIMRVVPDENESVNEVWISDRDRYSYAGVEHDDRVYTPLIKDDGLWHKVQWENALERAVQQIQSTIAEHGADEVVGLISPNTTVEEQHLFQKWLRGLGVSNIDSRLGHTVFDSDAYGGFQPGMATPFSDLELSEHVLWVGTHANIDAPILGVKCRKAALAGAEMHVLNPVDYRLPFRADQKCITNPHQMVTYLYQILCRLDAAHPQVKALEGQFDKGDDDFVLAVVKQLSAKSHIILGSLLLHSDYKDVSYGLVKAICELSGAKPIYLEPGANRLGAHLTGCLPYMGSKGEVVEKGANIAQALNKPRKLYVLFQIEPHEDLSIYGQQAITALESAEHVICITPYVTEKLLTLATTVLPSVTSYETSGTFYNIEGKAQSFTGAIQPKGLARPGWKILRVLGNVSQQTDFDYESSVQIREAFNDRQEHTVTMDYLATSSPAKSGGMSLVLEQGGYQQDMLTRRSKPLQQSALSGKTAIHLNPATATEKGVMGHKHVGLKLGGQSVTMPLIIDGRVPIDVVYLYYGREGVTPLDHQVADVELLEVSE